MVTCSMIRREPTKAQVDAVIETYHEFPTKEITLPMLKAARDKTALGLYEIKCILTDYISKTYERNKV